MTHYLDQPILPILGYLSWKVERHPIALVGLSTSRDVVSIQLFANVSVVSSHIESNYPIVVWNRTNLSSFNLNPRL